MARIVPFPRRTRFDFYRIAKWGAPIGLVLLLLAFVAVYQKTNNKTAALVGATPPISVVDGDTVRAGGVTYRLAGFDAPETGNKARCASEQTLATAATRRLRELIANRKADLQQVACACVKGAANATFWANNW